MSVDHQLRPRDDLRCLDNKVILKNAWVPYLGNKRFRFIDGRGRTGRLPTGKRIHPGRCFAR